MLRAGPLAKRLEIRNERYSMDNALRDFETENGDQLPPHQELVFHNYAWQHSSQQAVGFWYWTQMSRLEPKNMCLKFSKTDATSLFLAVQNARP